MQLGAIEYMFFKNREDAGQRLCQSLNKYKEQDVVVYGLPRGGVVVAAEIAKYLHAPLELIFAHKIGHPQHPEYAIAAISESGYLVPSQDLPFSNTDWFEEEKQRQMKAMKDRRQRYLKGKRDIPVEDKIAILVDDGIATGLTMLAGIEELRSRNPKKIVVVAPVSPKSTADLIRTLADEFVGVEIEDDHFLGAVGAYFQEFGQVEDETVMDLLKNPFNQRDR